MTRHAGHENSKHLTEGQLPARPLPGIHLVRVELLPTAKPLEQLFGPHDVADFVRTQIGKLDRECFAVLHLNAKHNVLSMEVVSIGALQSALVHPREVFKGAILANAAAILCAHNHPSGDLTPSPEDIAIQKRLTLSGELLGIPVLDFLIVTAERHVSMA